MHRDRRLLGKRNLVVILLITLFLCNFFVFSEVTAITVNKKSFPQNESLTTQNSLKISSANTANEIGVSLATYLGGNSFDYYGGIAVNASGNMYITGSTSSSNFPTKNAFNATYSGGSFGNDSDAFVTELNSTGSLVLSTYLGGNSPDSGSAIAVDSSGNIYITGTTSSSNFPTKNAFNATYGGGMYGNATDAFVTKFNATGDLVFSTYLGGSSFEGGTGIAVDSTGSIYVIGHTTSSNFPMKNAYDSTFNSANFGSTIFIAKFNSTGGLEFSTYFGGGSFDVGTGITVDKNNNFYITGYTGSLDFPMKNAYNSTYGGSLDAFIAKFNSNGKLLLSTYIGGSLGDLASGIAVDSFGNIYITGTTTSSNFPTKNAYNSVYSGGFDTFVCKFDSTGNLVFSTYVGGKGYEQSMGIAVDSSGNSYITGDTFSSDFPIKNAYEMSHGGTSNAILFELSPDGKLLYSTLFGGNSVDGAFGVAVDNAGNIYITGITDSTNIPTKDAFQSTYGGLGDDFVARFSIFQVSITTNGLSNSSNTSSTKNPQTDYYFLGILALPLLILFRKGKRKFSKK